MTIRETKNTHVLVIEHFGVEDFLPQATAFFELLSKRARAVDSVSEVLLELEKRSKGCGSGLVGLEFVLNFLCR